MIEVVQRISVQGTKPYYEDAVGAAGDFAWVIDGATSLVGDTGDDGGVVAQFSRALSDALRARAVRHTSVGNEADMNDMVRAAVVHATSVLGPIPVGEPWEPPSAAFALAHVTADRVRVVQAGDVAWQVLATLLVTTGVDTAAGVETTQKLVRSLEAGQHEYRDELEDARYDVTTVATRSVRASGDRVDSTTVSEIRADDRAIEGEVRAARRRMSTAIERAFTREHAAPSGRHSDTVASLRAARVTFAASGKIDAIVAGVEGRAANIFTELTDTHRVAVRGAGDEALARFTDIVSSSSTPQRVPLVVPSSRMVPTRVSQQDTSGTVVSPVPVDRYPNHLLRSERDGLYPVQLNSWEKDVLYAESAREGFIGWLRNTGSADSTVGGVYTDVYGKDRRVVPDFLFFHTVAGKVKVSIVDPHTATLSDSLEKLQGMADFVAAYPDAFYRVEVLSKTTVDGEVVFRALDLTSDEVQQAVAGATDARELYADGGPSHTYR